MAAWCGRQNLSLTETRFVAPDLRELSPEELAGAVGPEIFVEPREKEDAKCRRETSKRL